MNYLVSVSDKQESPHCCCINWMDHWKKATCRKRISCSNVKCYSEDLAGTLVVDESGNQLVIPLCKKCASQVGYLVVAEAQVSAHKLPSCNISSFVQMNKSK